MINWRFRFIALISICVHRLLPKRLLFWGKKSDEIYFAYVDPKSIDKTSYIGDMAYLLLGENASYGSFTGLWSWFIYDFKKNVMCKLCGELMQGEKGMTYQYLVKRQSVKEADKIWNKLLVLKAALTETGYLSQYQLNNLSRELFVGKFRLPRNETFVGLNKKGKLIRLYSGRHRLALAQHLNIEEIPVIITVHHPKAKKFLPVKCRLIIGCNNDYKPFD